MNPFSVPLLISSFLMLFFGIFVLKRNPKSVLTIAFLSICLSCVIWMFIYFLAYNLNNEMLITLLFRIAYCGITFISISTLFYTTCFFNIYKKLNRIALIYGLIACFFILKTNLLIKGIRRYFWGYYPIAGAYHPIYLLIFIILLLLSFYLIISSFKTFHLDPLKKNQTKYILVAYIIFCFAVFDFLPNYGVEFYPIGFIPAILFLAIIAYAIAKHHLMDVNIVIRRSLVYSILITIFTIIYLSTVILAEKFFQGIFGYSSVLISIISSSIIALLFIPLKNKLQSLIDTILLGKPFEKITEENELLRQELLHTEKLKTIATFASGMAHEIKNPLTAIKTFTEYLPKKNDDKEFLDKFSKIVGSEVEKIDDLVHQLLDYSKPSPLQLKKTDIHSLIDNTLELLNNQFIKYNIKINKDYTLDATCSTLMVDPNQMKQVFLNLFLNAVEAMDTSGILTVKTSLSTKSFIRGKKVEVRIVDTGPGIAEKDISHIFEPFYTTKDKGTGLGLSIVHSIIKRHNGHIYVESKIREGASFIVELPL
ncbi:MAG: ATP-binding protein [Candidatus Firestonebacteria bacterium]